MPEDLVIARNPEPDSSLPYLIRIPLGERSDDTREAPEFYAAITTVREALRGHADRSVEVGEG